MSSYFTLELDTIPPLLEIIAPTYTTPTQINEIIILSNEPLAEFQEIYAIDSIGRRIDYSFQYQVDKYVGYINFNNMFGTITIYARLKDESLNESILYSKQIEVLNDSFLKVTIWNKAMDLDISDKVMVLDSALKTMVITPKDYAMKLINKEKVSEIKCEVIGT